jgi:signal peptide peptidase SppA
MSAHMTEAGTSPLATIGRMLPAGWMSRAPVCAVVRLTGAIGMATPLRPGLSLASLDETLARAFAQRRVKAVALAINSPGGSAVQSALLFNRIRALAEEHDTRVYAFCEDVAASGGYLLALAADEIYADPSSIVGSIGVVSAGFGFVEAIHKLGIERRVHTAGKAKAILDPFQPERADDVSRLKAIQEDVHEGFKSLVRSRRAGKLAGADEEIFSGAFWSGRKALELGLIDGLGDMRAVLRQKLGEDLVFRPVSRPGRWLMRRIAGTGEGPRFDRQGASLTAGFAEDLIAALEVRALWHRFGL